MGQQAHGPAKVVGAQASHRLRARPFYHSPAASTKRLSALGRRELIDKGMVK
jgi:hypothetical protein